MLSSPNALKSLLIRFLVVLTAIALACLWVLLGARPALAQDRTINYSNTHPRGARLFQCRPQCWGICGR